MTKALARQIIRDALRVRDQERVWIHTWDHTLELAQEVAQQAYLHGASVTLTLMTETLLSHILKKAPQEAVTTTPVHWLAGVRKSDVLVVLDGPNDPAPLKAADKGKALNAVGQIIQLLSTAVDSRVRTLFVRSTAFTEAAAKTYGFSLSTLMQENDRCMSATQSSIINLGKRITTLLSKHRDIHLSSSEGTDLRFRTRGRSLIDDGIIDQDDVQSRNVLAKMPAGSIFIPVDPTSTEGTVVFKWPRAYLGEVIENLRLDFKKGQVVGMRALKGEKTIEGALQAGKGAKDQLTSLTFGINENATTNLGQPLDDLIPGSITLGLGANTFLGGSSHSNVAYSHTLNDAIVSIGPTAVIMDEKLTI